MNAKRHSHQTVTNKSDRRAVNAPLRDDQARLRQLGPLSREQGILAFNERVLSMAENGNVPLLERLRYLTIVGAIRFDVGFRLGRTIPDPNNTMPKDDDLLIFQTPGAMHLTIGEAF